MYRELCKDLNDSIGCHAQVLSLNFRTKHQNLCCVHYLLMYIQQYATLYHTESHVANDTHIIIGSKYPCDGWNTGEEINVSGGSRTRLHFFIERIEGLAGDSAVITDAGHGLSGSRMCQSCY